MAVVLRRICAALLGVSMMLAFAGCSLVPDRPAEMLAGLKAVSGVAEATGYGMSGCCGGRNYHFTVHLVDDPSPDTLAGVVAAYGVGLEPLKVESSEFTLQWNQGEIARQLRILSGTEKNRKMPDVKYLRGMATWPTNLPLSASADVLGFKISLTSDDSSFLSDLAKMAAAHLDAQNLEAYSNRYSVSWDHGDPPIDLFDSVAKVAPDASKVSVGTVANQPGMQDSIQTTWLAASSTPDSVAAASVLTQMHAVTDIWANVTSPLLLSLKLGTTYQVELVNTKCPSRMGPRNVEFWEYANRVGHRVVAAPSTC
jgi:hypothetical protein